MKPSKKLGADFSQLDNLEEDIECVYQQKVYCDLCQNSYSSDLRFFRDSSDLRRHREMVHEKKKNYNCDLC